MEKPSENKNEVLNTILTLGGIFLGAYLITKFKHADTTPSSLNKHFDSNENPEGKKSSVVQIAKNESGLNLRQTAILKAIKEKGMLTPKELQSLNPDISSRTLRRDMDVLAKKKYVSQKGSTKSTFYKYSGR